MKNLISILVLISTVISLIDSVNKKKTRNTKGQDWQKTFKETPTKLNNTNPSSSAKTTQPAPVTINEVSVPVVDLNPQATMGTTLLIPEVREFEDWDNISSEEVSGPKVQKTSLKLNEENGSAVSELFNKPEALAHALLTKEVLGKPRALEPWQRR